MYTKTTEGTNRTLRAYNLPPSQDSAATRSTSDLKTLDVRGCTTGSVLHHQIIDIKKIYELNKKSFRREGCFVAQKEKKGIEMQVNQERNRLLVVSFIMTIIFVFISWMITEGNMMMVIVGVVLEIILILILYWIFK